MSWLIFLSFIKGFWVIKLPIGYLSKAFIGIVACFYIYSRKFISRASFLLFIFASGTFFPVTSLDAFLQSAVVFFSALSAILLMEMRPQYFIRVLRTSLILIVTYGCIENLFVITTKHPRDIGSFGPPIISVASLIYAFLLIGVGRKFFLLKATLSTMFGYFSLTFTSVLASVGSVTPALVHHRVLKVMFFVTFIGLCLLVFKIDAKILKEQLKIYNLFINGRLSIIESHLRIWLTDCSLIFGCGPIYSDSKMPDVHSDLFINNIKIRDANVHNTYFGLIVDFGFLGFLLVSYNIYLFSKILKFSGYQIKFAVTFILICLFFEKGTTASIFWLNLAFMYQQLKISKYSGL